MEKDKYLGLLRDNTFKWYPRKKLSLGLNQTSFHLSNNDFKRPDHSQEEAEETIFNIMKNLGREREDGLFTEEGVTPDQHHHSKYSTKRH